MPACHRVYDCGRARYIQAHVPELVPAHKAHLYSFISNKAFRLFSARNLR